MKQKVIFSYQIIISLIYYIIKFSPITLGEDPFRPPITFLLLRSSVIACSRLCWDSQSNMELGIRGVKDILLAHNKSRPLKLLKYKQGCPAKDRPLSTKDGRSSVWHADQMI